MEDNLEHLEHLCGMAVGFPVEICRVGNKPLFQVMPHATAVAGVVAEWWDDYAVKGQQYFDNPLQAAVRFAAAWNARKKEAR
ncbi:MAG TPA: hypothetical protein VJ124_10145 [Pyrinomonadaceae bacterium]|nr:hypothetical protein [Pyrinomonadaceae bacterium]